MCYREKIMKLANNTQQEEYKAFINKIRQEKRGTSNIAKMLVVFALAVFMAVILCVILIENSAILDKFETETATEANGFFKFSRKKSDFNIPFLPRRQNILLLF